jgi:hypothetical protein
VLSAAPWGVVGASYLVGGSLHLVTAVACGQGVCIKAPPGCCLLIGSPHLIWLYSVLLVRERDGSSEEMRTCWTLRLPGHYNCAS